MDVIGAGFGRTGTTSMKAALEHLGFGPTFHMLEIMEDIRRIEPWKRAANGEQVDWEQALAGYRSTVDWPGCTYYKQLMDVFPNAKVLLTVRDPERWYASVYKTIFPLINGEAELDDEWQTEALPTLNKMIWQEEGSTFEGRFGDKDHAISVFNAHTDEVKRTVPADRLLVYEVGEGWEPLCSFLEVPVPDVDFPHANDGGSFTDVITQAREGATSHE